MIEGNTLRFIESAESLPLIDPGLHDKVSAMMSGLKYWESEAVEELTIIERDWRQGKRSQEELKGAARNADRRIELAVMLRKSAGETGEEFYSPLAFLQRRSESPLARDLDETIYGTDRDRDLIVYGEE